MLRPGRTEKITQRNGLTIWFCWLMVTKNVPNQKVGQEVGNGLKGAKAASKLTKNLISLLLFM